MARHVAQAGVTVVLCDSGERVGDIGPMADDLAKGVDGAGPDVGVAMVQQLERSWYEQLLTGPALVLLASIARQRVQRTLQHLRVVVVQGADQVDNRRFVGQMIEQRRAQAPDDRLRVVHAAPHRGHCLRPGLPQVDLGSLTPFRVGQLRDPSVEVGGRRKAMHRQLTVGTLVTDGE